MDTVCYIMLHLLRHLVVGNQQSVETSNLSWQEKDAPRGSNGHLLWSKPRAVYHKQCLNALGAWPGQSTDSLFVLDPDPFFAQDLCKEYKGFKGMATIATSPQKVKWLESLAMSPQASGEKTEVPGALGRLKANLNELNERCREIASAAPELPEEVRAAKQSGESNRMPMLYDFVLQNDPQVTNVALGTPQESTAVDERALLPDDLHLVQAALHVGVLLTNSQWPEAAGGKALQLARHVEAGELVLEWTAAFVIQKDFKEDGGDQEDNGDVRCHCRVQHSKSAALLDWLSSMQYIILSHNS